jgi:DNA-binding MarR family transcriptional regulator
MSLALLEVLWETDGLTPGELAERLHVATPTIVKSETRMEASGLLTRRRDETDAWVDASSRSRPRWCISAGT